ncbi:hypothetical protein KSP40_PGU008496 [Platanthera guangdongensis]|uniref:Late embryogenesis abundant protein n=1 Tax=Platanthera guangdongensis TaxID=2320717 RepID=A0ABR2LF68_9ASPA
MERSAATRGIFAGGIFAIAASGRGSEWMSNCKAPVPAWKEKSRMEDGRTRERGEEESVEEIKRDEMADRAGEKVQHGAENAGGFLQQTGEQVKHMAQVVAETAKNAVGLGGSDAAAANKNSPELIGSDSGNTMNAAGFGNTGSTTATHTTTTKR